MKVGAVGIGAIQLLLDVHRRGRFVWGGVGQRELLCERQTDDARERQFLPAQTVPHGDELLVLRLQFDLGSQQINARGEAGVSQIHRLVVEGLRGLDLRFGSIHTRLRRDGLQVSLGNDQYDHLAHILVTESFRGEAARGRSLVMQRVQVQNRAGHADARVEECERADHCGEAGKPKSLGGQVHLGSIL